MWSIITLRPCINPTDTFSSDFTGKSKDQNANTKTKFISWLAINFYYSSRTPR